VTPHAEDAEYPRCSRILSATGGPTSTLERTTAAGHDHSTGRNRAASDRPGAGDAAGETDPEVAAAIREAREMAREVGDGDDGTSVESDAGGNDGETDSAASDDPRTRPRNGTPFLVDGERRVWRPDQRTFAPETRADALEYYEEVGPVAQVVVREATKAMSFGADEYDERVTPEVIRTARRDLRRDARGPRRRGGEFDDWLAESEFDEDDVVRIGSDNVDNVVWHPIPFADTVIAATYQEEPDAAASTLRRNAFGRVYREEFYESGR